VIPIDLTGKRTLVTGASRGIGYAVARGFVRAGARVTILSEDATIHDAAGRLTAELGSPIGAEICNIADGAAVARVVGGLGPLDILVNNAGLELITPLDAPAEEVDRVWRRIHDINVLGSTWVTREAVKQMPSGARIVFTASSWGRQGVAQFGAYASSKHAILGLVRCFARELGRRGITVNGVCPGWVRTEAAMRSCHEMSRRTGRSEEAIIGDVIAAQCMDGLMEPEDIVGLYLFLASDLASSITGQNISIDRGEVMA
jgi:3-hydroxybutyrate dehydrogenase